MTGFRWQTGADQRCALCGHGDDPEALLPGPDSLRSGELTDFSCVDQTACLARQDPGTAVSEFAGSFSRVPGTRTQITVEVPDPVGYTEVSPGDPARERLELVSLAGDLVRQMADARAAELTGQLVAFDGYQGAAGELRLGIATPGPPPRPGPGRMPWFDSHAGYHDGQQRDGSGQFAPAAPDYDRQLWSHTLRNPAHRAHLISGAQQLPLPDSQQLSTQGSDVTGTRSRRDGEEQAGSLPQRPARRLEGGDIDTAAQYRPLPDPIPTRAAETRGQRGAAPARRRSRRRLAYGTGRRPARQHTQSSAGDDDYGSGTGVDTSGPSGGASET